MRAVPSSAEASKPSLLLWMILVALISGSVTFALLNHQSDIRLAERRQQQNSYTAHVAPQQQREQPLNDIDRALLHMASNARDMNGDGKVNCIDYATLFYEAYPNARVIWNYNPPTLNHLFIIVDEVEIEPQAYRRSSYRDRGQYRMRTYWGSKYDPSKNEDVTDTYKLWWW